VDTILNSQLFTIHNSKFTIHNSQSVIHNSQLGSGTGTPAGARTPTRTRTCKGIVPVGTGTYPHGCSGYRRVRVPPQVPLSYIINNLFTILIKLRKRAQVVFGGGREEGVVVATRKSWQPPKTSTRCSFSGLREVVVTRERSQPRKQAKHSFWGWVVAAGRYRRVVVMKTSTRCSFRGWVWWLVGFEGWW